MSSISRASNIRRNGDATGLHHSKTQAFSRSQPEVSQCIRNPTRKYKGKCESAKIQDPNPEDGMAELGFLGTPWPGLKRNKEGQTIV
jgi:hypothetical protein